MDRVVSRTLRDTKLRGYKVSQLLCELNEALTRLYRVSKALSALTEHRGREIAEVMLYECVKLLARLWKVSARVYEDASDRH